jgi:hypothetical protein
MNNTLPLLLLLLLQTVPTLQHRGTSPPPLAPTVAQPAGPSTLPLGAEGEYRWRENDEVIQLFVENKQLQGYLTRRTARNDAGSAPLTFDFTSGSARNGRVQFATRALHGETYTFDGIVQRNAHPTEQQGEWLLEGTLVLHTGDTSVPEHISAPLAPGSTR